MLDWLSGASRHLNSRAFNVLTAEFWWIQVSPPFKPHCCLLQMKVLFEPMIENDKPQNEKHVLIPIAAKVPGGLIGWQDPFKLGSRDLNEDKIWSSFVIWVVQAAITFYHLTCYNISTSVISWCLNVSLLPKATLGSYPNMPNKTWQVMLLTLSVWSPLCP